MHSLYRLPSLCFLLAFMAIPARSQWAWKVFGFLNQARSYMQAVYIGNGQVLVIGGYAGSSETASPTASCELIDINTKTITPAATLNVPRAEFVALLDPDSNVVVVSGDMVGDQNSGPLTPTVERYDRAARSWKIIGSLRIARYQHIASFINDHEILVAGGRHADLSTMADAEIFDVTTGTSRIVKSFPVPINSAVMGFTSKGDVVGMAGRQGGTNSPRDRNVHRYDPGSNSWILTGILGEAIDGAQLIKLWDGRLAISGGSRAESPADFSRNVEIENGNVWSNLAVMARERHWGGMAQWRADSIITIGGYDNTDRAMTSTDWIDVTTGKSAPGPLLNVPHERFATVSVPTAYSGNRVVRANILAISGETIHAVTATPVVEILERPVCHFDLSAGTDQTICSGDQVTIAATGGTSYEWSPPTGLSCTTCKSPIASPGTTTTYTVTAFDDAGCIGNAQVTVNVRPTPSLQPPTSVTLCPGTGLQIGAEASGGLPPYTYSWSPQIGLSDLNVARPFANPTVTTTYTVEAIDANGCRGKAQVVVKVNTPPSVRPPQDVLLCPGAIGSIGAEATGGVPPYRYSWTPATGLSSATAAIPTASPSVPTLYTVHVTDANGCSDSATVRVAPVQPLEIASSLATGVLEIDPTVVKGLRCRDILLRNPGPAPMTLSAASMTRNLEFSIPPGQLPMTIPAGEERDLQVCFMPDDSKLLRDTLDLLWDCSTVIPLQAYGRWDTLSGPVCNSIIQIRPPDSNATMLRALPAYPNPAAASITIPIEMAYDAEQLGDISAVLYDASGKPIADGAYRSNRTDRSGDICSQTGSITLSIHGLANGTYFARISSSGSTIVVPVIIQR